jgi:hypothetical protein
MRGGCLVERALRARVEKLCAGGSISWKGSCVAFGDAYLWVADPREFMERALRARFKSICAGGSAPAPWVPFFARAKKGTKESTPWSLRRPNNGRSPARRASAGRSPNSPGAGKRASGSTKRLATSPGLARCSARDTGRLATQLRSWRGEIFNTTYPLFTLSKSGARGFHTPVARAEYRRPTGSIQASPCSSRAALFAADELASARWGEGEAEYSWKSSGLPCRRTGAPKFGAPWVRRGARALRGVLSFGFFSLHEQRKETCRGSATHKYASPQATQNHLQGLSTGNQPLRSHA